MNERSRISERIANEIHAEHALNLSEYKGIHRDALPLVATVEYLAARDGIRTPSVVEVGPTPTFAYETKRFSARFSPERAASQLAGENLRREIAPIAYLADRHKDWRLVAVSPHDMPEELKEKLMMGRPELYMHTLGPHRTHGFEPNDAFDEAYIRGEPEALNRLYPELFKHLNGPPDIIFGRHVFDSTAEDYPVGKLTTMAAMLLKPGGYLVSMVYGTDAERSRVPLHGHYHFPFDDIGNMEHVGVISFPDGPKTTRERLYVHIYKKKGDTVRPAYAARLRSRKKSV
jgi:hypothetical protein